jgi:hypothetical protein
VSKRTGRQVAWCQTAESLRCRVKRVSIVQRAGRLTDMGLGRRAKAYEEVEFSRMVAIPTEYAEIRFPAYYRGIGRLLRVCVSLPVRRNRIDLSRVGMFYYPLQAVQGSTGTATSVSAPFKLDGERTKFLDLLWNQWLAEEAARLAADLLAADWLPRFGADPYLALGAFGDAAPTWFSEKVADHLTTTACWPSRANNDGPGLAKAPEIVVPIDPPLDGFLGADRYLDQRLSDSKNACELAVRYGAKRFTLNSLIRLRCAPSDSSEIETKLSANEADYYFTEYSTALQNATRQVQMARALTTLSRHLSNANRKDLKESASTLAADGTLHAAAHLVRVETEIWEVCPAPLASRLHPELLSHKAIADLGRPFDIDTWICEAAERTGQWDIDDQELEALYRHLLAEGAQIGRKALAAVRTSPIVKDHRGDWGRQRQ